MAVCGTQSTFKLYTFLSIIKSAHEVKKAYNDVYTLESNLTTTKNYS